jgi:ParB-like chromosome segregation protein Spo0J
MALGVKKVPCIRKHLSEREFKALNLALNRISGEWDEQKCAPIIQTLKDIPEIQLTGFTQKEIDELIGNINFPTATAEEQGRLDQKAPATCPTCGTELVCLKCQPTLGLV